MPITTKICTVDDVGTSPEFFDLVAAYARESVIPELGTANPQLEMYRNLERAGALKVLAAYENEEVVGFIAFVILPMPHQGTLAATVQSFFVRPQSRKRGAGLRLLREAERIASDCGARGFFASAPTGGTLPQVLSHIGYRNTNLTFFKGLP